MVRLIASRRTRVCRLRPGKSTTTMTSIIAMTPVPASPRTSKLFRRFIVPPEAIILTALKISAGDRRSTSSCAP